MKHRSNTNIFNIMQEIVNWHLGDMSQKVGKVANFFHVLEMPERTGTDFHDESVSLDTMLSPEFDGIDLSGEQF